MAFYSLLFFIVSTPYSIFLFLCSAWITSFILTFLSLGVQVDSFPRLGQELNFGKSWTAHQRPAYTSVNTKKAASATATATVTAAAPAAEKKVEAKL